jgi:hypothetical protein
MQVLYPVLRASGCAETAERGAQRRCDVGYDAAPGELITLVLRHLDSVSAPGK